VVLNSTELVSFVSVTDLISDIKARTCGESISNEVVRRIFGKNFNEIIGGWRKLNIKSPMMFIFPKYN
jgi:hypothetical protein